MQSRPISLSSVCVSLLILGRAIFGMMYMNQQAEMYVNTATAIRNGFNILGTDNLELKDFELRAQRP